MKKDNRGLSLVELIIVIAIMVILTGLVATSIGLANSKPADECAKKIEATLQDLRISSMGKYDAYLEIYKSNNQIYAKQVLTMDGSGTTSEKLVVVGAKGVDLTYEFDNSGSYALLSDGSSIKIKYDRSSGAFAIPDGYSGRISGIKCTKGSRTVDLKLTLSTGKIKIQ